MSTNRLQSSPRREFSCWLIAALLLVAFALTLSAFSHRFGFDTKLVDMPIWWLTALLCVSGAVYCGFCWALIRSQQVPNAPGLVLLIIATGLVARLALFTSEPTIEIDYLRYLWDGGVTVAGLNPYIVAPADVAKLSPDHPLRDLAREAGPVLERIGHGQLTTIYPPVAQAAFALAHWLQPWSLDAWRIVILVSDIITLLLLFQLLQKAGAPLSWSAIYWWNPLIVKELFNSAHMDVLIAPFLLFALLAALQRRQLLATAALCFAAGVKVWPILLLPLVWRALLNKPRKLAAAMFLAASLLLLFALPFLLAGLERDAGLVAYATTWRISAPLFGMIEIAIAALTPDTWSASTLTRLTVAAMVGSLALVLAYRTEPDGSNLTASALLIVAALLFLSPTVYPWYVAWLLPLIALHPGMGMGMLLLTATAPLYHARFYYNVRGTYEVFELYVVWLIWLPVWIACAWQLVRHLSRQSTWISTSTSSPATSSHSHGT